VIDVSTRGGALSAALIGAVAGGAVYAGVQYLMRAPELTSPFRPAEGELG
jgi:hypothetical protein